MVLITQYIVHLYNSLLGLCTLGYEWILTAPTEWFTKGDIYNLQNDYISIECILALCIR